MNLEYDLPCIPASRLKPPRRDRWLSLVEVAAIMKLAHPKRDERRRYVRRAIRRAEQRDGCRYTKRVGKALYVSVQALETLLPYDAETFTQLGRSVAQIAQVQRSHGRQLNDHGAKHRAVAKSIKTLEEHQALTDQALEGIGKVLGHNRATTGPKVAAL